MSDFWHATWEVARKEVLQHLRTKRLLIIGVFLAFTLMLVTLIIPTVFFPGIEDSPDPGDPSTENLIFLFYLNASVFGGYFLIQLLAITITSDAVCSEWSNRTIFLLLSKPVPRSAFVLGKFIGAVLSVVPTFVILFTLQYGFIQFFYPGSPTGEEVGRFFLALGFLSLGAMAVSSVALFFSSLLRSNVRSLILTLLCLFVLFPIVGNIGDFAYFADETDGEGPEADRSDAKYDWSHYVSPERVMTSAGTVLTEGNEDDFFAVSFFIPQFAPAREWLSALSGIGFTILFVSLSVFVVQRRDFD